MSRTLAPLLPASYWGSAISFLAGGWVKSSTLISFPPSPIKTTLLVVALIYLLRSFIVYFLDLVDLSQELMGECTIQLVEEALPRNLVNQVVIVNRG